MSLVARKLCYKILSYTEIVGLTRQEGTALFNTLQDFSSDACAA